MVGHQRQSGSRDESAGIAISAEEGVRSEFPFFPRLLESCQGERENAIGRKN